MIKFLGALLPFLYLIVKEYLTATGRAAQLDREYRIDRETFRALVQGALNKQISGMAAASQGAGNAWDSSENDQNSKPPL